jgi:hypothetical protein
LTSEIKPADITYLNLASYDIIVFSVEWKEKIISNDEAQAIINFVKSGKGLFLIGEHGLSKTSWSPKWNCSVNKIAKSFGAEIDSVMLCDSHYYYHDNNDPDGYNFYYNNLINGTETCSHIAESFMLSKEFLNKYPDVINNNSEAENFLNILYKTFFDRNPDTEGLSWWKDRLLIDRKKSGVVAKSFIYSREFEKVCSDYGIKFK